MITELNIFEPHFTQEHKKLTYDKNKVGSYCNVDLLTKYVYNEASGIPS